MLNPSEQRSMVIDIHRGTTHDGPGMRTTVFFKGCSLSCAWCQNPEGIAFGQEIWWEERKCINCLSCVAACPEDAVHDSEDGIRVDPLKCTLCGACVEACPSQALAFTGKEWKLQDLLNEATRDKDYYASFGGGVTASGGEPLGQYHFLVEFFKALKAQGVHTALDTCGMVSEAAFDAVLPYTDHLLYDIKLFDSVLHQQYTGKPNQAILDNLLYVTEKYLRPANGAKKLWIRTPLIPGVTTREENLAQIGAFIRQNLLDVLERWELCSFNSACNAKYQKMGLTWEFETTRLMTQDQIDQVKAFALSSGFPADRLVISGLVSKGA